MPELGQAPQGVTTRSTALQALAELASGRFAERMRLDAAARLLVLVKRVLVLRAAGLLPEVPPRPADRRAVVEVERIITGWNPNAITAAEFVADMPLRDVQLLVELAPAWAGAAITPVR